MYNFHDFFCNFDSFTLPESFLVSDILWTYPSLFVVCCLPLLSTEPELDVDEFFVVVVPLLWKVDFSQFLLSFFPSLITHTMTITLPSSCSTVWEAFNILLSFFCSQLCCLQCLVFLPSTSLLCSDRQHVKVI